MSSKRNQIECTHSASFRKPKHWQTSTIQEHGRGHDDSVWFELLDMTKIQETFRKQERFSYNEVSISLRLVVVLRYLQQHIENEMKYLWKWQVI